jgi:GNAT superfamily N-acetyltransferase
VTQRTPAESAPYATRPLDASTWGAFAELVERNNGVYGGCWCIAHHVEYQRGVSDPRTLKEELVRSGRAHAALVFDENGLAQGWCQYGSPEELALKHQREYAKNPPPRARWRITCIFVDKGHRGRGVARAGLEGALAQIAEAGGGRVEAISEVTAGREAHSRFLFSATVELFEQCGFARERQVGKHAWIVSREIDPAEALTDGPRRRTPGCRRRAVRRRIRRRELPAAGRRRRGAPAIRSWSPTTANRFDHRPT